MGSALCACHPWAIAWSLPNRALDPDMAAAGLELVPGAPCSLTPAGPSPPGKGEGRIACSLPTRCDPRAPRLPWEPWLAGALGPGSRDLGVPTRVTGKESQLSQSQAPPSYLGRSLRLQAHSGTSLSRPTKQTVAVGTMWLSLRIEGREGTVRLPRRKAEAPTGPVLHPGCLLRPRPWLPSR